MKELVIIDILREGFSFYRKNFKILFTLSFVIAMINIFGMLPAFLLQLFNESTILLLEFVVNMITTYLIIKFGICFMIVVWELIHNRGITIEKAYEQSSKYFWKSVGNTILFGFTILIPVLLLQFINRSQLEVLYKYPLIIILLFIIGLVSSYFYFAPISVPLSPGISNKLGYSMYIVKGKVIRVMIIIFISTYLLHIPVYFINSLGTISPAYLSLIKGSITIIINLALLPFSMSVTVMLYDKLVKLKDKKRS